MLNSNVVKMDIQSDIEQFDILKIINYKTLQKYLPYFYFRTYKKNQRLYNEGDPRDKVFFLLDGYVMYECGSEEGSMLYLDIVKKNQMFPYGGIFSENTYTNTAVAATDIMVYFTSSHMFEELIKSNEKALLHTIKKLVSILALHQERVQKIIIPCAHERVLNALQYLITDLGEKNGTDIIIPCPLTAAMIAKISGTTRETASLVLNQLKKDKIISVNAKIIRIQQPEYFQLD